MQAHVCVQQTCLDLLEAGKNVSVVVDGVSSQRRGDRAVALALLARAGASLTTTESIMLALCGTAAHPKFRDISWLLKERNQDWETLGSKLDALDRIL